MRIAAALFPPSTGTRTSIGLLALRVLAGGAMMNHGWGKIQDPLHWMSGPDAPPAVFQALAAIAEFFGGLGLVLGTLSVVAAFGIACTMAVAIQTHLREGQGFGDFELAAVYLCIAVLIMTNGAGRFSGDELVAKRLGAPQPS